MQVLDALARGNVRIRVVSDAAFDRRYPGAGGIYDPNTDTILLPQRALRNGRTLALTMVHEGVHWLQRHVGHTRLASLGGAIASAVRTHGASSQSGTARQRDLQDEAQAYILESVAAREMGIRDFGLGTDGSGRTRSFEETLSTVAANPLYA